MNITIVGAGAIGGVIGAYLAQDGQKVTLVDINEEHVSVLQQDGITIETVEGEFTVPVHAKTVEQLVAEEQPLDVVILAVKAQHTEEAVLSFESLLTDESVVVSMQNGLTENIIAGRIGPERTIGSFVNLFADYQKPGYIQYGGVGSLFIGELDGRITDRLLQLQERLKSWGAAKVTDNIYGFLWSKLAYGAILTATATTDAKIVEVLDPVENRELFVDVAAEVLQVAEKNGVVVEEFDSWTPDKVYKNGHKQPEYDEVFNSLVRLLGTYKKVKTGIWRDLAIRKRKTEVPFHLGPVIEEGERYGFDMTLTRTILEMIVDIEEGRREMSLDNIEELRHKRLQSLS